MWFISLIKPFAFSLSFLGFGMGMFPEVGDRPHGAFAFACLSIALLIAWSELIRILKK